MEVPLSAALALVCGIGLYDNNPEVTNIRTNRIIGRCKSPLASRAGIKKTEELARIPPANEFRMLADAAAAKGSRLNMRVPFQEFFQRSGDT